MSDPTGPLHDLATVVAPAVFTPEFDTVRRAAGHRRTVRVSALAFAAVLAVGTAVAVPVLSAGSHSRQAPSGVGPVIKAPDLGSGGHGIAFLSTSVGYRFGTQCLPHKPSCALRLEATTDGGRTWQRRPVPALQPVDTRVTAWPYVQTIGPESLVLLNGEQRWLSTDGGRHWVLAPPRVAPAVVQAPRSSLVTSSCDTTTACAQPRLAVIDPATGVAAPLANQPPLSRQQTVTRGDDGSIWATGADANGSSAVSVSHDGGRTWVTRPLPSLRTDETNAVQVFTIDGTLAYAAVFGGRGPEHAITLARTTDGGATWRVLSRPTALDQENTLDAALLPDGRFLILQQGERPGVFASADGISFAPLAGAPRKLYSLRAFPGGLLGEGDPDSGTTTPTTTPTTATNYVTTDGRTWRALPKQPPPD